MVLIVVMVLIIRMGVILFQYRKTRDRKTLQAQTFFWIGVGLAAINLFELLAEEKLVKGSIMLLVGIGLMIQGYRMKKQLQAENEQSM